MAEPYVKAYQNPTTGKVEYRSVGSLMQAQDDKRIGGYLVRFTDASDPDLHGEFFSKGTNLWLNEHPIKGKPILLDHGFDMKFKSVPVGILDFAKVDEVGLWVEGKLKDRDEYEEMLRGWRAQKFLETDDETIRLTASGIEKAVMTFFETGKAQWSSGALPQSVEIDPQTHHIKSWAIIEGTAVMTPAEPDGTQISLKSAFQTLDNILTSIQPATTATEGDTGHKGLGKADVETSNKTNSTKGAMKMEEILALIQEHLSAMQEAIAGAMGGGEAQMAMDEEQVMDEVRSIAKEDGAMPEDMTDEQKMAKALELVTKAAEAVYARKSNQRSQFAKAAQGLADGWKKSAPPASAPLPGFSNDKENPVKEAKKSYDVSVGEMRQYAAMTPEQMALGVKLAMSKIPEWQRKGFTLKNFTDNQILSEEYLRTMAHKAAGRLDGWTPSNDAPSLNDYATMKSYRFLKADELHATDITGQGAEWVEYFYDTQLWRRVREDTELFNAMSGKGMRVVDVPRGTKGMNVKLENGSGTVYTLTEGGSLDATGRPATVVSPTQIATSEVEADLKKHVIAQGFTFELQERSIIDVVSYLQEDMQTMLTEAIEDSFINGDTATAANTNINLIDGTPASGLTAPLYLAYDGIRKAYLSDSAYYTDNSGSALAATDFEEVRALFPLRFRRKRNNILLLVDDGIETKARRLSEWFTVSQPETQAPFFTGDISKLVGYDVLPSGFLSKANSAGKISATAGNNTLGQIIGVYAPYWQYGRQVNINIEEVRDPFSQTTTFVAAISHLLMKRGAYASVGMFNIGVS